MPNERLAGISAIKLVGIVDMPATLKTEANANCQFTLNWTPDLGPLGKV